MSAPQQLTLFGLDTAEPLQEAVGSRRLVQLGPRVVAFRFARSR